VGQASHMARVEGGDPLQGDAVPLLLKGLDRSPGNALSVTQVLRGVGQVLRCATGRASQELLVILVIVLVLFGAKRLPELARSLGSSLKEFKKGVDEAKAEDTTPATSKDDGGQIPPRAAARACSYCKTSLDVDWSHCPRCGTAVVQGQELPPRG